MRALSEPDPLIQLTIAKSLIRVDRHAATTAGVATIAANSLKDPDGRTPNPAIKPWNPRWQIARQAAEVLGELHAEPATSIPALIEGLSATNREIAIASFRALIKFKDQAEAAIPALRKAAERQDIPHWVKAELVHLDPATAKP